MKTLPIKITTDKNKPKRKRFTAEADVEIDSQRSTFYGYGATEAGAVWCLICVWVNTLIEKGVDDQEHRVKYFAKRS